MTDISDRLIDEIQRATIPQKVTLEGVDYLDRPLFLPPGERRPTPIILHTLQGLVDYVASNIDPVVGHDQGAAVYVESESVVSIGSGVDGRDNVRTVWAKAELHSLFGRDGFVFGTSYSAEEFNIKLQSLFVDSGQRAALLKMVGNFTDEGTTQVEDDGVTQKVTVKKGVAMRAIEQVPNPVYLAPYRTFREVEQPVSPFIFRVQKAKEGDLPRCALYEGDGGIWRLTAITLIKEWIAGALKSKDLELPIIA